jgi:hypothetical protein
MGLDQYAFKVRPVLTDNEGEKEEREEIAYWRKFSPLQAYMEDLYHDRGGEQEFNCVELPLDTDTLDDLEECYQKLEDREGFFWNVRDDDGSHRKHNEELVAQFIKDARAALNDGWKVVYYSWW